MSRGASRVYFDSGNVPGLRSNEEGTSTLLATLFLYGDITPDFGRDCFSRKERELLSVIDDRHWSVPIAGSGQKMIILGLKGVD